MTTKECIKYVEDHLVIKPATRNGAYTSGRTIDPQGCVNHSLGVAQPSIDSIFSNMNQSGAGWGVNAILGDFHKGEGKIYLTLNWTGRPWGCGSGSKGSYNNSCIQWEVCEPAGHTYAGGTMIGYDVKKNQAYFDRMWKLLVAWNVYCVKKFGYPIDCICDHSESYKAGYGTNHADMMHWLPKHGKSMDQLRAEVRAILNNDSAEKSEKKLEDLQATDLIGLSEKEVVQKVAPLFTAEEKRSGILACVIFAQWILESGYGSTDLAKKANNFFGMKETLSNNTWPGSSWDGKSIVVIDTKEYINGKWMTIPANFRKYPSIKESIADHSAYLLGATKWYQGTTLRYAGLENCRDYEKAAKIIKAGGYATDPDYVAKLTNIIEKWNLTQYNYGSSVVPSSTPDSGTSYPQCPFGVKVLVSDLPIYKKSSGKESVGVTGIGTFTIVSVKNGRGLLKSYSEKQNGWIDLRDAKKCRTLDTIPGEEFLVKIEIDDLRIRKGPSVTAEFTGSYVPHGIYTIVEVVKGAGSNAGWGLLKSYETNRNGWISLDYATRM